MRPGGVIVCERPKTVRFSLMTWAVRQKWRRSCRLVPSGSGSCIIQGAALPLTSQQSKDHLVHSLAVDHESIPERALVNHPVLHEDGSGVRCECRRFHTSGTEFCEALSKQQPC